MALYDGTNAPLIKVYLDTGNRTLGLFTIGWSELGGTDELGQYTPFTSLTQMQTEDVKSIAIRRGRTREDQSIQAGTLTLSMDNTLGTYDPEFVKGNPVTAASGSGAYVTYTSVNDLVPGDIVSVYDLTVSGLNLSFYTVVSATATTFTVASARTGSCTGQSGYYVSGYSDSSLQSLLVAGTGVRVTGTITYGGGPVEVSLFSGFIEQIDKDLSLQPVTTITCIDGLAKMANMFSDIDTGYLGDYTAISRILSDAGWNFGLAGSSNDLYIISTVPTGDVLTMLDPIVKTQPGAMFYCDVDGAATWLNFGVFDAGSWSGKTKMFTMTDTRASNNVVEYDEISVIGGEKYRRNQVTVHNTAPSGYENNVTKFNQASVARYGPFSAQIDTYYSSPYVAEVAQNLADQFANSEYRVDSIGFECVGFSSTLWYNILHSDLGSAVQVNRTPIYTNGNALVYQCYIQELNHDIKPNSWRMSLTLSPGT
jgi:hypothetical protein